MTDITGWFVHTLKDGTIDWQGEIVAVEDDVVLLQLYSWLDGSPTKIVPFSKVELFTRCVLYRTEEQWKYAAENTKQRAA